MNYKGNRPLNILKSNWYVGCFNKNEIPELLFRRAVPTAKSLNNVGKNLFCKFQALQPFCGNSQKLNFYKDPVEKNCHLQNVAPPPI